MDNLIINTLEEESEAQRGPLHGCGLMSSSRREAIAGVREIEGAGGGLREMP